MAIDFNAEPYYDDFDDTKKFHRILFKPGYAVQARELTQLQTQLQDQIAKFGNHIFVEGTIILGGDRAYETDLLSIKLESLFSNNIVVISNFANAEIVGATSGTKAFVKMAEAATATDPNTLLVKITSGTAFTAGETISCVVNSVTFQAQIKPSGETPFNNAMMLSIESGVFYTRGCFVYSDAQKVTISKYTNTASKNIGFLVNEEIITSDEDSTLLDNSQGSYNYAAPGADRYAIDLQLTVKDISTVIDNFVEIARTDEGKLVINLLETVYSAIGDELARRTYDESGDYTVKPWKIQIQDDPADANKLIAVLDPGKAYVQGYEFETIGQTKLSLNRARDAASSAVVNNVDVNMSYGSYVYVDTLIGVFNTSTFTTVTLRDETTATIGTAQVRYLQWVAGTPGTAGGIYKMYLFNIIMNAGRFFKNIETIIASGASAIVDLLSKEGGVVGGDVLLSGADSPGLVFPLNNSYVKTIRALDPVTLLPTVASDSDYQFQRTITNVVFDASGRADITTGSASLLFVGAVGLLSTTVRLQSYHVVVTTAGGGFAVGDVIDFTFGTRSIEITSAGQGATLRAVTASGFTATVIATINANAQFEKTKVLSGYTKKVITNNLNQARGGRDSLDVADVYDIGVGGVAAVYNIGANDGSTTSVNGTTGAITWGSGVTRTDVTANYTLDNGQRAEFYDHGSLVLTGTAPVTNTDNLLVVYRNFAHTGTGFFSVDSYTSSGVSYDNIPLFTDPASGVVYSLRDSIDFRPRRTDNATGFDTAQIAGPDSTFNADYQYYLGRMDKILAMPNKTFQVITGVPAIVPKVPTDNTNGMAIYALVIPPYTGKASDVSVKYVDNKRYTMRDIGRLDTRIKNLEYYTQLSLLEKQAKDTSIPDASNFEKFKQGFATDPFTSADIFSANSTTWSQRRWAWWNSWFNGENSWNNSGGVNYNANSIADAGDADFNAAIDPVNQELRAPFTVGFSDFNDPTLVNTSRGNELVTLSYTESSIISQMVASQSINVNPFNIIKFNGKLALEPAFDQWVDTNVLPVINQVVQVQVPDAAGVTVTNMVDTNGGRGRSRTTSTTTTVTNNVVNSNTVSLGANVVDVQFVPFIRAKTVAGLGKGLKPLAQVYPFVDSTIVSQYCRPLTLVTVQNHTGTLFTTETDAQETLSFKTGGVGGTTVATAKAMYYSSPTLVDPTKRRLSVKDIVQVTGPIAVGHTVVGSGGGSATVTAVTPVDLRGVAVSGTAGQFTCTAGALAIGDSIFVTGTLSGTGTITGYTPATGKIYKVSAITGTSPSVTGFTLTEENNAAIVTTAGTTTGLTFFRSAALNADEYGFLAFEFQIPANKFATGERTIRLIDNTSNDIDLSSTTAEAKYTANGLVQDVQETLLTTRAVQRQTVTTINGEWYDPLAQTFQIGERAHPNGVHISSIDIYFKTKSATVPVTMQIRRTVNGYPSSYSDIPFAEIDLMPEKVNISANASLPTTFKFPSPIYLSPNDYAITLISQCNEYEVWIAEMGKTQVDGTRIIDKQPYNGSLFISQNAATWTAVQEQDLKFDIKRAVFGATGTADFEIADPSGVVNFSTIYANSASITPPGTSLTWSAAAYTDGAISNSEFLPIEIDQDINYATLRTLKAKAGLGFSSFILRATLGSDTARKVSPVIDSSVLSLVTVNNTINNDSSFEGSISVNAGSLTSGRSYTITALGTTPWGSIGAATAATGTAGTTSNLAGVAITGTAGQFSCTSTNLVVGQLVTISGTLGGTGTITGYTNPTTYKISATNGTTTFTLTTTLDAAIVTTAGTPTGLTYALPNTLTIASGVTGTFRVGQQLSGTNITAGTTITNFISGSGGVGSYLTSVVLAGAVSGTISAFQLGTQFTATGVGSGTGVTSTVTKSGGGAVAKYITKSINLADGFDATNINVTVDINRPSGTDVKVYYKILPTEKNTPINEESWVEMVPEYSLPASTGSLDFKEYRFFPVGAIVSNIPQDSPITSKFNSFKIKIVMLSSDVTRSPKLRDLRVIALES